MICQKCGKEIDDNSDFCMYCGTKIEHTPEKNICPFCGKEIRPGSKFCNYCGKNLTEAENSQSVLQNVQEVKRINPDSFSWNNEEVSVSDNESQNSTAEENVQNSADNQAKNNYTAELKQPEEQFSQQNMAAQPVSEKTDNVEIKSNKKVLVFCIVSMVVCLVCVFSMVFIFTNRNKDAVQTDAGNSSEAVTAATTQQTTTETTTQTEPTTAATTTAPQTTTAPPQTTTAAKTTAKTTVTKAAKKPKPVKVLSVKEIYNMTKGTIRDKIGKDFKAVCTYDKKNGDIKGITSPRHFPHVIITFENMPDTGDVSQIKKYFLNGEYDDDIVKSMTITDGGYLGTLNGVTSKVGMTYNDLLVSIDSLSGAYYSDSTKQLTAYGVINGLGTRYEGITFYFSANNSAQNLFGESDYSMKGLTKDAGKSKCTCVKLYHYAEDSTSSAEYKTVADTDDTPVLLNAPDDENGAKMVELKKGESVLVSYTSTDDYGQDWAYVCEYETNFGVKQGYIKAEYLE